MTHGTESGYSTGCRCDRCKAGHRAYVSAWRQKPAQAKKRQIKALAKVKAESLRIAALDVEVQRIKSELTTSLPMEWEIQKAIREERDALRLRVADLEAQLDRMVDAALELEKRGWGKAPYVKSGRGRPRKAKR